MHDLDKIQDFTEELDLEGPDDDGDSMDEYEDLMPGSEDDEELELAEELLEIEDEAELDQFLGSLITKGVRGGRRFLRSQAGKALKKVMRRTVKKALPQIGGALGSYAAGRLGFDPDTGRRLGRRGAGGLGSWLGLELEGLEFEDQELEGARRLVRAVQEAAQKTEANQGAGEPEQVAKVETKKALARHLGTAAKAELETATGSGKRSGRWIRRGNRIILLGV